MQQFSTCLWFDTQAEEAVKFYTSVFPDSKTGRAVLYLKDGFEYHGKPEGSVCSIEFEINGSQYIAMNGGPVFRFNEAISIVVNCDSQQEVDLYWEKLSQGGDPDAQQCGWLKDKFGVSWQIVPTRFNDMLNSKDRTKVARVWKAMFTMKKLDLSVLEKAFKS